MFKIELKGNKLNVSGELNMKDPPESTPQPGQRMGKSLILGSTGGYVSLPGGDPGDKIMITVIRKNPNFVKV